MTSEYEDTRRVYYGEDNASFVPVCIKCGRFVKADKEVMFNEMGPVGDNAICSKCGRIQMLFEGYI